MMMLGMDSLRLLRNRWVVFLHDLTWIPVSILVAFWIRFNLAVIPHLYLPGVVYLSLVALPVYACMFWLFGCYRGIWRYASIPDLIRIVKAVVFGALATTLLAFLITRLAVIPRSVLLLYPLLLILGLGTSRFIYRIIKNSLFGFRVINDDDKRALIVGAGTVAESLIRDLQHHGVFLPVALVDDDAGKQGNELHGVRVRGTLNDIERLIRSYEIDIVLIAMPNAARNTIDRILQICNLNKIPCRTLPSLAELADGKIEVSRLRPVMVEDLLGREPIILDTHGISEFLRGKRVLVTGGGGSIGAELCRQVSRHEPSLLVIVDNSECNLYHIDQELSMSVPSLIYSSVLCDIQDKHAVDNLFAKVRPEVIFHAAAYKHVPIVENNVIEGIRNNIFGTCNVADAAVRHGAMKFVLISTDKTVNPTNVMGTTKRVAEIYCQSLNHDKKTQLVITRFGNVLASAGSVIPLFKNQIEAGGPVTVTHPDITRYFMTISEAASLILQAATIGNGGDIFVLDMGEPVRIHDLAEKLIELSGYRPNVDIDIVYTGLRPGEKMHEELFYEKEELQGTTHPKLLLANSAHTPLSAIVSDLDKLLLAVENGNADAAMSLLRTLVPEYAPQDQTEPGTSIRKPIMHLVG
jgi:FlaA1/EpsC-like NDP-sugar epimerase